MSWFMTVVRKYAEFSGRSRRSEYWYFILVYLIVYVGLAIVDGAVGTFDYRSGIGLLSGIFALALLLPSLGVGIRRLHDIGRSGWWLLIGIIPVVGTIILLLFLAKDSEAGANRFRSESQGRHLSARREGAWSPSRAPALPRSMRSR